MNRNPYIIAILGFGMAGGMLSPPMLLNVRGALLLLAPGLLISSPQLLLFLAYLVGATLTIMIGGVPAALYERFLGKGETTAVSLWIWLAATALVALPGILTGLQLAL